MSNLTFSLKLIKELVEYRKSYSKAWEVIVSIQNDKQKVQLRNGHDNWQHFEGSIDSDELVFVKTVTDEGWNEELKGDRQAAHIFDYIQHHKKAMLYHSKKALKVA